MAGQEIAGYYDFISIVCKLHIYLHLFITLSLFTYEIIDLSIQRSIQKVILSLLFFYALLFIISSIVEF